MRPVSLHLKNFGPFADSSIDFSKLDDIFLIMGKTGSGKTTLFDAICFALYGKVPGSRGAHLNRLRSEYAKDSEACAVTLDFAVNAAVYRIVRSPKQDTPKGTEETVVLYELENDRPVKPIAKKSKVEKRITELIGIKADEFFKIVLLPQGEFAQFLKQNSTERTSVMKKLFPIEQAEAVTKRALDKYKDLEAEQRAAEQTLQELSRRFSPKDYEEQHEKLTAQVAASDDKLKALAAEARTLQELLAVLETERKAQLQLNTIQAEQEKNAAEQTAVDALKKSLELSHRAMPLHAALEHAENAQKTLLEENAVYTRALQQKTEEEAKKSEAEKNAASNPALEAETQGLQGKLPLLEEMIAGEEETRTIRRDVQELAVGITALKEQLAKDTAAAARKETEKAGVLKQSEGAALLDTQWEHARQLKDALIKLKDLSESSADADTELVRIVDELAQIQQRLARLDEQEPVLQEELRALKTQKADTETALMAARLAAQLSAGEPCPVCGSREHPFAARAADPAYGLDEQIAAHEKNLNALKQEQAVLHSKHEGAGNELQRSQKRKQPLVTRYAELWAVFAQALSDGDTALAVLSPKEIPSVQTAAALLSKQVALLNEITKHRGAAQQAAKRLPALFKETELLKANIAETEKTLAHNTERERLQKDKLAELTVKNAAKLQAVLELLGKKDSKPPPDAKAVHAQVQARIKTLTAQLTERKTALEAAKIAAASSAAREESIRKQKEAADARHQEASAALASALADSPFADVSALKAAFLSPQAAESREAKIAAWRDERSRIEQALREAVQKKEESTAQKQRFGPLALSADLDTRMGTIQQEQAAAATQRDAVFAARIGLENNLRDFTAAEERRRIVNEKAGHIRALSDILSGKNPKKTTFTAWLLSLYLTEVTQYACTHLEKMSESRYSLVAVPDSGTKQGYQGLDLAVFDANTAKQRPCATLSGGETFMASISLALGLADSIQTRSGGVRLDAVFIDEGFGTLDDATLDKALGILDGLRDHRMVGLISHVGDMRTRIPCCIEVLKETTGSTLKVTGA
ncbi:AAA family ATPase [Breznakiellaceae bacterium SP9]